MVVNFIDYHRLALNSCLRIFRYRGSVRRSLLFLNLSSKVWELFINYRSNTIKAIVISQFFFFFLYMSVQTPTSTLIFHVEFPRAMISKCVTLIYALMLYIKSWKNVLMKTFTERWHNPYTNLPPARFYEVLISKNGCFMTIYALNLSCK